MNCVFLRVYIPNSAISGSYGSFEALERGDQFRSVQFCSVAQSCPTLCDSMVYRSPGSSIHEIPQEKILEWFAIPFSGDLPNPGFEPRSPTL